MAISNAVIRKLAEIDLPEGKLREVLLALADGDDIVTSPIRSKGAIRQEKYRERKAQKEVSHDDVTGDATPPSLPLPNDNNSNPTPTHPSSSVPSEDSARAKPQTKSKSVAAEIRLILGQALCEQTVSDVILHRKAVKAAPTVRAAQLLVKQLLATGHPEDAAMMMIARGWKGFEAEWFEKTKARDGPQSSKGTPNHYYAGIIERAENERDHHNAVRRPSIPHEDVGAEYRGGPTIDGGAESGRERELFHIEGFGADGRITRGTGKTGLLD